MNARQKPDCSVDATRIAGSLLDPVLNVEQFELLAA
jgi:hypothetical protein